MKRITITFTIFLLGLAPIFSQNVTIPDANFLAALIAEGVDTNGDGQISNAEAEAIENLDVHRRSISDLSGIEAFVNLELLFCYDNQLTSLDVSDCEALQHLFCQYNQLTSLDVSGCFGLQSLCTGFGFFEESDNYYFVVTPDSTDFNNPPNHLSHLDLSNNTNLMKLDCSGNDLTHIDLSQNYNLWYLDCRLNQISSLDLSSNNLLISLDCGGNLLTEIDISKCVYLEALLCGNNISHQLFDNGSYGLYDYSCTRFVDSLLVYSQDFPEYNQITSLDISNNIGLIVLEVGGNPLKSLDLTGHPELAELIINDIPNLYVCVDSLPLQFIYVCVSLYPDPPIFGLTEIDTTGSSNVYFTTECTIGVEEQYPEELSIYPNPTNSLLTIKIDQPDHHSIEIISLSGKLIYRTEMEGNSKQIDLTPFSKGIYFITVRSKEFVRTEKIIKY